MIGEHVGNAEKQQIVKSNVYSIIFYAIVDIKSEDTCIPCE